MGWQLAIGPLRRAVKMQQQPFLDWLEGRQRAVHAPAELAARFGVAVRVIKIGAADQV